MAGKTTLETRQEAKLAWESLQTLLHPDILHAPQLDWSLVEYRCIRYLYKEAREASWLNPLAFMVLILTSHARLDQHTIELHLYHVHARWRLLFPTYNISSFEEWNPSIHLPRYLNDAQLPDTLDMRQGFLQFYNSIVHHVSAYLRSLPEALHQRYQQWAFPVLPIDIYRNLSRHGIVRFEQRQRRKEETDAITPHFAHIRGEAHLRWNQLKRLQEQFCEAVRLAQSGEAVLPLAFSYEEPRLGQQLHFRLWDCTSFMREHGDKTKVFVAEKNHCFLEFRYAEQLRDGNHDPDALLWFGDLLRYDLLGSGPIYGSLEEVKRKQSYLQSWGYGEEARGEETQPFRTGIPALLVWSSSQKPFMSQAQKLCKGLLFLIEPLFAAATFGLAALDVFTTTGARNGELVQVSLDPDCLYTLKVEGIVRFLLRLRPKGRDKPADYIVGTETRKNLEKVGEFLQNHYHLQPGECLPSVQFNTHNTRAHSFNEARPYLFQYNHRHLTQEALNACMRFLCHGLVFQTADGRPVALKAHLLRHAFASHIHQIEGVPLDVVAVMLHQKDVRVTAYYAAPPWQQVLATANSFLDKFATHLDSVEDAFVRAPAELQRQLEEAKAQVGSLNTVPGGECTCHAICPIAFACTGCVYNVPDPDREEEIVEQEQWAFIRLDQVKKRSQGPEIVKMQALIQRCQVTRQEMQLIRTYRKDESYVPTITIEQTGRGTEKTEAMVTQTSPGKTSAHGITG